MNQNVETALKEARNSANTKLAPFIFRSILDLYQQGHYEINADMVKSKCMQIERSTNWNGRIPAICNAMRNSVYYVNQRFDGSLAKISSENRDHNGFSIKFS